MPNEEESMKNNEMWKVKGKAMDTNTGKSQSQS